MPKTVSQPDSNLDEMGEQLQELEVEVINNQTQILADFTCGTPVNNASFKYDFYQNTKNKAHMRAFYPLNAKDDDISEEEAREKAMQKSERDERSFYEKNDMLTEAFGSKRKQKMMTTRLSNNVSNTSTAITEAVEDMIEMGKDFTAVEVEEVSLFNCNYEASKPEDVYKFNDIIPEDIRQACLEEAMCLMDPQKSDVENWKKENDLRSKQYIAWHATHTHSAVRANEAIHHEYICCLQLMIYLAMAYKYRKSRSTPALRHLFKTANKAVETWLSTNFTIDGTAMPQRCKDKLLATAIIIAWHIDSFQFDLQMIGDLFGLPTKKLSFIVRALGGIVKNLRKGEISTSFAVLKIPVVKPKSNDEIKKRGGRR